MLWSRTDGKDEGPLLVLLHGLGGTGEVWRGLEALLPQAWSGGWLRLDLAGHGRSPWVADYTFAAHARAVAALLRDDREVVLLGHSMGGMVALALAARLARPCRVVAFSVKTSWPEEHVAGMQAQAVRTPKVFATREEAIALHLRVSGLQELLAPTDPVLLAGVAEVEDGWRLAQDPRSHDFGTPDVEALLAACGCPVTLARGAEDRMVPVADASVVPDHVTLDGLGHNPHVERPEALLPLLNR